MNQQSKISALEAKNEDLVFELRKNSDIIYSLETWKKESTNLLMVASTEKEALEARVKELEVPLNTCKNDYWFMANLLEKYKSFITSGNSEREKGRRGVAIKGKNTGGTGTRGNFT